MKLVSNVLTVFRREMSAYFNAAIAYIFIIVFVLLNGGLFMTPFFLSSRADMRPFFMTLPFLLAVFIPAITMRQWAEEKRGNTLELLLTFPMSTQVLVLGKFLASFVFYLIALSGTLFIPIMLSVLGKPDVGVMISGYLGAVLLGAFLLAIGIFISGLCRDQIVAFILSMVICFGLHLIGTEFMATSIDGWFPGFGSLLREFIGSSGHFNAFTKGIVDNRDILYFVVGSGLFLALNGFWLDGRMRAGATRNFAIVTIICIGIFFTANWFLSSFSLGRFDFTEAKLHTISPATKKIIRELKSPVTAKLYISPADKMPTGMKTLEQDIVDKLDEIRVHSGGNFQYKILHMEAANVVEGAAGTEEESLEQQLQQKGIQPFQVRAVESDEVAVRLVYASIGLSYKEKPEEVIPQLVPERLRDLEYTIVSKVYRMTLDKTPRIAIVAPYQEQQVDPQVQALLEQLGGGQVSDSFRDDQYETLQLALRYDGYEIQRILLTEEEQIEDEVDTLVVIEPMGLNDRQRYEINKFLVGGGSVFMAIQNYEYQYAPAGRDLQIIPNNKQPGINPLLKSWGFEVDTRILVDEQHDMINLGGGARLGPFSMSIPVKIPIQILVGGTNMNSDVSITSQLSPLFYLWGTALKLDDEKIKSQGLEVQTLFSSSKDSWTVPFKADALGPQDLIQNTNTPEGPFPLAILVKGQFADAYAGKEIPAWPVEPDPENPDAVTQAEPEPAVSIAQAPGQLVLTGASSFLQKHLINGGGNLSFFMNSVHAITLGEDLVTIRSKKPVDRTINRISAAKKVFWRLLVIFLVPVIIAIIGAFRGVLRKQSKQNHLKSYTNV